MDEICFPAHINIKSGMIQTVEQHCRNTALYASRYLKPLHLSDTGYMIGVLHDAGKYTEKFKNYIIRASKGEKPARGSVNHTFAGVRMILALFHKQGSDNDVYYKTIRDMLAYAVGAHHGQFDCFGRNGKNGFDYRKNKEDDHYNEKLYKEASGHFLSQCISKSDLTDFYRKSCQEMRIYLKKIQSLASRQNTAEVNGIGKNVWVCFFYFGCMARLLQSALIDADRQDTAEFMGDFSFPVQPEDMKPVWEEQLAFAEEKMAAFDRSTEINHARMVISDYCRKAAETDCHLFRLNVPTGAGKTVSSLRFALSHAAKYGKNRIIITAPLLTILEQNADVIRNFIKDQSLILEHHSNVVEPENDEDELCVNELFTENWNAPIIITTLVQFLNTCFSGKTACIRRFHALADSVIIIDEVQSVPDQFLSMFNQMISFLTEICNATVVLCSATQPDLEGSAAFPVKVHSAEMVAYDKKIWDAFRRTDIIDAGKCEMKNLSYKIRELTRGFPSVLVICNTKKESEDLYREFSNTDRCFHISASMCVKHRRTVMDEIRKALKEKNTGTVFCISTQVMEAGVDMSFACVIRLLAGMENLVQAAGRCNRNGESPEKEPVYAINCTNEKLSMLHEIEMEKRASVITLHQWEKDPSCFDWDLSSDKTIRTYYKTLYRSYPEDYQLAPVKGADYNLFDLLSLNLAFSSANDDGYILHQAFKEAGRHFSVFDGDTVSVIVPYEEGKEIISDLGTERAKYDLQYRAGLLKKAKEYMVTLYPFQIKQLQKEGALYSAMEGNADFPALLDGYYDRETGVTIYGSTMDYFGV